jgi:hypothetical protein
MQRKCLIKRLIYINLINKRETTIYEGISLG